MNFLFLFFVFFNVIVVNCINSNANATWVRRLPSSLKETSWFQILFSLSTEIVSTTSIAMGIIVSLGESKEVFIMFLFFIFYFN